MPLLRRSSSTKFWRDHHGEVKPVIKTPPMGTPSRFDPFEGRSMSRQGTLPNARMEEPLPPLPALPSEHSDRPEIPIRTSSSASPMASPAASIAAAASIIHWPATSYRMPADVRQRALWFLGQVVMSHDVLPGAYITDKIFLPTQTWSIHVDSLCARQLSMRAAFLESVARSMGHLMLTPKISGALERKLSEIWEHSLNLHMHRPGTTATAPSPPLSDNEQFPGPVRIRRGPKSHLRSLVTRRSASPDRPDDLLYQFSPPNSLPKYIEAVDSIMAALESCSAAWRDFVIFTVVAHVADDVLDIHERYMETIKFALLGLV